MCFVEELLVVYQSKTKRICKSITYNLFIDPQCPPTIDFLTIELKFSSSALHASFTLWENRK